MLGPANEDCCSMFASWLRAVWRSAAAAVRRTPRAGAFEAKTGLARRAGLRSHLGAEADGARSLRRWE